MDAEWVNRAGIIAAALSLFFIAPEIIGVERLRRVEDRLESYLNSLDTVLGKLWAFPGIPRSSLQRISPGFPGFPGSSEPLFVQTAVDGLLTGLLGLAIAAVACVPAVVLALLLKVTAGDAVALAVSETLCFSILSSLVGDALLFVGRDSPPAGITVRMEETKSRLRRIIARPFKIAGAPGAWVVYLSYTSVVTSLRATARSSTKLLAGSDSLRALVFGTGVLLFFGGMAAQFVATF